MKEMGFDYYAIGMNVIMKIMMTEVGFDYFDYGDVADLHAGCDDNNDHNDK